MKHEKLAECNYCRRNYYYDENLECPGCGAVDPIFKSLPSTNSFEGTPTFQNSDYSSQVDAEAARLKRLDRFHIDVMRTEGNLPSIDWEAEDYHRLWGRYPGEESHPKTTDKTKDGHEGNDDAFGGGPNY